MMFWNVAYSLVLAFAAADQPAGASGGFLQKLPTDGTWVSYFMEAKAEVGPMQEMSGTMKLKSVGSETVNGETFRWIEIEFDGDNNGRKMRTVMKVLVREKDLNGAATAGLTIDRGWQMNVVGEAKQEAKELSDFEKSSSGPMGFFFKSAMKAPKSVKRAKTVDFQKGQLKLETATTGELDLRLQENQPKDFSSSVRQTVWKHKAVPTGTAAMEMQMQMRQKDKVVMKMTMLFTVQDYGKDAKSALPDKK